MTWKTILVPHDFSSPANHAAALARDEAKAHGGTLMLLHVVELPAQLTQDTALIPDNTGAPISVRDYARVAAEQHLDDIAARLAKDGTKPAVFVRFGRPAEEISRSPRRSRSM